MNQQAEIMEQVCQSVRLRFHRTHDNFRVDEDMVSFVTLEVVKAAAKHDVSRGMGFDSWLYFKRDKAIQDYWKVYYRRKKHGLSFTSLDGLVDKDDENISNDRRRNLLPEVHEFTTEQALTMNRLVDDLNDSDRSLVIERFWNGRSQQQIADMTGVTESAICQRLQRILRRMKEAA